MRLNIKNEREKKLFHDEGDEEEGQTLRDRNWKLGGKPGASHQATVDVER